MSKIAEIVGKTMTHKSLGKVIVLNVIKNSRTKVEIKVVQRANGWDEDTQTYKRVKKISPNLNKLGEEIGKTIKIKTYKHENSQYGHIDICHVNDLK